jgi:penicillin-binding protein 1A
MRPSPATSAIRPARRGWLIASTALAVVAAVYGGALVLLSRPQIEAALRERILVALAARLGAVTLGPDVHVDPLLRVSFGPMTVAASRPGDPPVVRIERVKVRPSLSGLLSGRVEAASVRLYGVRIEAGRSGRAVLALAERLRRPLAGRAIPPPADRPRAAVEAAGAPPALAGTEDDDPSIHVRDLVVAFPLGELEVEAGPFDALLQRDRGRSPDAERMRAEVRLPGGGVAAVTLRRVPAGWHAEGRISDLGPKAIPAPLRTGPIELAGGTLSFQITGDADAGLGRARARARISAQRVALAGERIGAEPLGPLSLDAEGELTWDGDERRVALHGGTVRLGRVPISVSGQVRLGAGFPFDLSVRADGVDFAAATAALPPSIGLPAEAPHPTGTLDARVDLSGPLSAPAAWSIDAALDLSRLREASRRAPPVTLRAPFVHRPEVDRGSPPVLVVGPRSPDFVPIADLPPHVVRAVTASEDAGFFGHDGFDFEELRIAFAQGAERGRLVRGGSTITQQLAKNLYLSREKTFARKVREAVVTVALEATVPKQRLLEIYLNVAEWGPRLWGIGPAARHWFGVEARDLTPRQAAFLATIIPNPVRFHSMWSRGAPSEGWDQRVNDLLLKLNAQGVLDDEALLAALSEALSFAQPDGAVARP